MAKLSIILRIANKKSVPSSLMLSTTWNCLSSNFTSSRELFIIVATITVVINFAKGNIFLKRNFNKEGRLLKGLLNYIEDKIEFVIDNTFCEFSFHS